MIYKEHYIELFINGQHVELESQKSLNLRFNNVLFDPTKISSTNAEYSFEFEVPSTPANDRIFNYANNLSKLDKFHCRWNAEVYADGDKIFEGSLTLNSYKDKMYKCNLVSVKSNSLDEIFGEAVLTDIPWYLPFDGAGDSGNTINYYNNEAHNLAQHEVVFPLVSYGAFQKSPSAGTESDDDIKEFSSKFDLDKYNRWYVESFYPSLSMLETMKKAFEWKGYSVAGDAFHNFFLRDVFMSTNLADGQIPIYNLGNPKFGQVSLSASLSTNGQSYYPQELNYPYFKVFGNVETEGSYLESKTEYNFESVFMYDILGSGSVNVNAPSYMYQPNEKVIVIPASGFYKVTMNVSSTLNTTGNLTVMHHIYDPLYRTMSDESISLPVGFNENTPIEIALVRNYEDNYELIKGKRNKNYETGNPNEETYTVNNRTYPNVNDWLTCFPHEDAYNSTLPTKQNDLTLYNTQGRRRNDGSVSEHVGGRRAGAVTRAGTVSGHEPYDHSGGGTTVHGDGFDSDSGRRWSPAKLGYVYNDGEIMAYDQAVSDAVICGLSSFYGGVASVMKNGYSWSKSNADENQAFYPEIGYSFMTRDTETGGVVFENTQHNYNTYINTPISYVNVNQQGTSMNGFISCMVWLEKDDVLELMEVHRGFTTTAGTNVLYNTTTNIDFTITAASPRSYYELQTAHYTYNSPSEYDYDLRLSNFLNKEKKVSEWIQNVADAFNLDILQSGNIITIDTKKKSVTIENNAVDIDNRCNSNDAESSSIDYPKSMAVKYKIDTEEWGFEKSVYPQSKLNDPDWRDYGDSGFTTIELNDDSYVTSSSDKNLQFSYTWYDNFTWISVDSAFTEDRTYTINLRLPVLSKYTYMIDGYDYVESMKHDGYGLTQRFWFRPDPTLAKVWLRTYPVENVEIYVPTNKWSNGSNMVCNLSYKTTEKSLLNTFFGITPYLASNFVEVEVYLSPQEYNMVKNGAMVHFDSDLYIPVEISGYDPSSYNPTTIKMMKKVI